MAKTICFIYTETIKPLYDDNTIIGSHNTNNMVTKKNLYLFSRPISLHYIIGTVTNNLFTEDKHIINIIKPRSMCIDNDIYKNYNITNEYALENGIEPDECITNFLKSIKSVDFIIGHNINFHLKTIIAEAMKYNIYINLNNYVIIDIINFYHKFNLLLISELAIKLNIKNIDSKPNIELIRDIFFKLYSKFIKSIN